MGNPIVLFDAAKQEEVTDYTTQDGKFKIGRFYRSVFPMYGVSAYGAPIRGATGGWRFSFGPEVHLAGSDAVAATLHLPDGISYDFTRSGNTFAPTPGFTPQSRYTLSLVGTPPSDWSNFVNASSQWQVIDATERRTWIFQTFQNPTPNTDQHFHIAEPISMTGPGGYRWSYAYDSVGTLQSITDSYGRSAQFTWNYYPFPTGGAPSVPPTIVNVPATIGKIVLPGGSTLTYTYDPPLDSNGFSTTLAVGRLVRAERDAPGGTTFDFTTYQYENATFPEFLTGITDARGVRFATFAYDARGRAISTQHAGGQNSYSIAFNSPSTNLPNELVRTVTNPLGKMAEYHWAHPSNSHRSQLTSIVGNASANCPASTGSYTYDANGFVASVTDEEGRVTAYINDSTGRPTSVTRGSGTPQAVATNLTWHATYNVATQIVEPGLTTTQTVDDTTGLITQIQQVDTTTQTVPYSTQGQTRTWGFGYDGTGRLTSATGPLPGTSTIYTYDPTGFLKTYTNELGQTTTVNIANAMGQPTSITDANGIVTALAYDERGRLTSASVDTDHVPATTTITYNPVGDIATIVDPIGATMTFAYDDARRLTSVTNSVGEVVTYTRDAMGNATSVTIARSGPTTTYSKTQTFDELGRLIKSVGAVPANSAYAFGYDKTSNLTSVSDPRSNVFSYGFDALNRLIRETDEQNAQVNLTRNGIDAITAYQDPRSLTTTYVRNGFGEIIQDASPDKGTSVYVRDQRGLVTQRTDPRGTVTNFTYDNAGRLTAKAYPSVPDAFVTNVWDFKSSTNSGIGRLGYSADQSGYDTRFYDGKGNITASARSSAISPDPILTPSTYDAAGNVTGMTMPSGWAVAYQRDALGRVIGVTATQPGATSAQTIVSGVTWNPYGAIQSLTFGNGVAETLATDTDARITTVTVLPSAGSALLNRSFAWTGETLNTITDNAVPAQSQSLMYSPTRRLTSAAGAYGSLAWTYDAVGNRTSETAAGVASAYVYPSTSNQLSSITPAGGSARSFTYDAAGNILTDNVGPGGAPLAYTFDEEGRLATATLTANPTETTAYLYDTRDRLVSRVMSHSSAPKQTILSLYDTHDHLIAETDDYGASQREYIWIDDMPVAVLDKLATATPVVYFVHVDHLMRPALMTDAGGSAVWRATYLPFGAVQSISASPQLDLRFPGQWFQLETGLAYNWHRHYDATTGRYVQPDPLGVGEDNGVRVKSLPGDLVGTGGLVASVHTDAAAKPVSWPNADDIIARWPALRPTHQDEPSIYGYAAQSPLTKIDPDGEQTLPFPIPVPGIAACLADPICAGVLGGVVIGAYICERRTPFSPGGGGGPLQRCLDAASGSEGGWDNFCASIPFRERNNVVGEGSAREACRRHQFSSSLEKKNWCQNQYGK